MKKARDEKKKMPSACALCNAGEWANAHRPLQLALVVCGVDRPDVQSVHAPQKVADLNLFRAFSRDLCYEGIEWRRLGESGRPIWQG